MNVPSLLSPSNLEPGVTEAVGRRPSSSKASRKSGDQAQVSTFDRLLKQALPVEKELDEASWLTAKVSSSPEPLPEDDRALAQGLPDGMEAAITSAEVMNVGMPDTSPVVSFTDVGSEITGASADAPDLQGEQALSAAITNMAGNVPRSAARDADSSGPIAGINVVKSIPSEPGRAAEAHGTSLPPLRTGLTNEVAKRDSDRDRSPRAKERVDLPFPASAPRPVEPSDSVNSESVVPGRQGLASPGDLPLNRLVAPGARSAQAIANSDATVAQMTSEGRGDTALKRQELSLSQGEESEPAQDPRIVPLGAPPQQVPASVSTASQKVEMINAQQTTPSRDLRLPLTSPRGIQLSGSDRAYASARPTDPRSTPSARTEDDTQPQTPGVMSGLNSRSDAAVRPPFSQPEASHSSVISHARPSHPESTSNVDSWRVSSPSESGSEQPDSKIVASSSPASGGASGSTTASPTPPVVQNMPGAQPFSLPPMPRPFHEIPSGFTPARLETPISEDAFPRVLGMKIGQWTDDGIQQVWLDVHPADMGPVAIQIALDGRQAELNFGAESAAARQIIESSLPELASALQAAGLTLSGGSISQEMPQSQSGQEAPSNRTSGSGPRNTGAEDSASAPQLPRPRAIRGIVDLYA